LQRRYSHPVDKTTGVRSDQTVILTAIDSAKAYPDALRRISYVDAETDNRLGFLTNNFVLPALTITRIYKCRWQVELFFKWVKQHLRIKTFFGTSENAVKTQIWISISIYVLVASSVSASGWRPVFTRFYRFSASRFLKKRPFYRPSKRSTPKPIWSTAATN